MTDPHPLDHLPCWVCKGDMTACRCPHRTVQADGPGTPTPEQPPPPGPAEVDAAADTDSPTPGGDGHD